MTTLVEPTQPETQARAENPSKSAHTAAKALSELLAPVRASLNTGIVLQVVASIATIGPYVAIAELARNFLAGGTADTRQVWVVVSFAVTALLVRLIFGGAALSVTHFADARLQGILRTRITQRLSQVRLGWFTQNSSGLIRKATQNDIHDLHYLVAHGAVETTAAIALPLIGVAYLFTLDWRLALIGISTIPLYFLIYSLMTRGMTERMMEMNAGIARISQTIVEFVSGISVVKTFGQAGQAHAAYRKAATEFGDAYDAWVRPMLRTSAFATLTICAPVIMLVNLAVGVWFISQGWVGVVDLVTATLVAMVIPSSIMTIDFGMQARREAAAAAGRIIEILQTPLLPETTNPKTPASAEVQLEDVQFSYDGKHLVLEKINLTLPVGTVTALVGPSGSGKSTLASLIARFEDVTDGSIRIGGVDLREIETRELYSRVAFVLQDVQLLRASVADNIRLARPEASIDRVREVARLAQIDERIIALPNGYDSVVGEDAQFSGGEAQRVSIARALLADPKILILDEATAFADPESEAAIQKALAHLVHGRTLLVIAHRLASITAVNQIVVLDHGRIAELGTHEQLLANRGVYARMWAAAIETIKESR